MLSDFTHPMLTKAWLWYILEQEGTEDYAS